MNEKYVIPLVKDIKNQKNCKFTVVSLFAGGGGSSTGYRMAGANVLAANEFIPEAIETYKSNWNDTIIFDEDVRNLQPEKILLSIKKNIGDIDLLDGSPPCSAFSMAGARENKWGKTTKYSDTIQSNIEDLFFEYIRILNGLMPRVFVAENVAGLTKGKAKGYFNEIIREMKSSGYNVECKILNAKYLGIPQSRNRAIFVGIRNDLWRDEFKNKLHPKPIKNIINLETAFNGLSLSDNDKKETDLKRFKVLQLLKNLKPGDTHQTAFTLTKASKYDVSPCIKATTGKIGARECYHWDNRAFSVSEIKRIMSIPDDYILTGNYSKKIERLGRMVPPLMIKAIAENIIKLGIFDEKYSK